MEIDLLRHPASPAPPIDGIRVTLSRLKPERFSLTYRVTGDISSLRLPPLMAAERGDDLWQTTCFEAFARLPSRDSYGEFNFSPSTRWAGYSFSAYRTDRRDFAFVTLPRIDIRVGSGKLELAVVVDFAGTTEDWRNEDLLVGLSAVIETKDGQKSYWAIAHPPGDPDFHHGDCFAARLRAPGPA